ncbi:MAG: hypothetical protein GXO08_03525 [Aquificae bacterium]|nr:hypothetical protein [Aquificota bacterium]
MSLSSLYRFALRLKGRGHFLSPKEVSFLKSLLQRFSEEEVKKTLERCFSELIPPDEREKSSLLRCKKLFEKNRKGGVYFNPRRVEGNSLEEVLRRLEPGARKKLLAELKERLRAAGLEPTEENARAILRFLLRKYL